jgi:hypothetical protein
MSALPASPAPRRELDSRPGRSCPLAYRYSPRVFRREPEVRAETIYVAGGLYGNVEALLALVDLVEREHAALVFNGDFHWFDVDPADFERIDAAVARFPALRGNVETEIAHDDAQAGCGCAYPADVSDAEVSRSNEILERLRATACEFPGRRARLRELPMHLVAEVGGARFGIVHGDAASLAGWGFAHDRLGSPSHQAWLESAFRESGMDAFASTHTCLPAYRQVAGGVVANNGAAGMPNFAGTRFGLATRISVRPCDPETRVLGIACKGVHLDAVRVDYDHEAWTARFLRSWPAASPAHASYFRRITEGPRLPLP